MCLLGGFVLHHGTPLRSPAGLLEQVHELHVAGLREQGHEHSKSAGIAFAMRRRLTFVWDRAETLVVALYTPHGPGYRMMPRGRLTRAAIRGYVRPRTIICLRGLPPALVAPTTCDIHPCHLQLCIKGGTTKLPVYNFNRRKKRANTTKKKPSQGKGTFRTLCELS